MEIKILQEDSSPIFTGQQIADMVGWVTYIEKEKRNLSVTMNSRKILCQGSRTWQRESKRRRDEYETNAKI